jgi:hypothetical protein
LELHGIASRSDCHADQPFSQVNIATVIDANFGNDETRLIVADTSVANFDRTHGNNPPAASLFEQLDIRRNMTLAVTRKTLPRNDNSLGELRFIGIKLTAASGE